jgi:hypothetical protein
MIGYNGVYWHVGDFATQELTGKAFAYARKLLNTESFGNGWEFIIGMLHRSILNSDRSP